MKVQALFIVWAFTSLYLVSYTAAFSHGASLSACADMRPKHIRAHLQDPQSNYITIHTNISFFPGDKIPVTVRSTRDFMGFMLQARRVSNDQIAGTFVNIPPGSKLLACFGDGDTVTHSEKSLKRNLSFVWKAPDQPVGDVRFFLSVVQSYFVYWARIQSSIVSQQTQNRTTAESRVASSAIKPTSLQVPNDLKGAFLSDKGNFIPDIMLTQFPRSTLSSLAEVAATLNLDPVHKEQEVSLSVPPDNRRFLPESLVESITSHAIRSSGGKQVNGSGMDDDLTLESSLQFQNLSVTAQDYSSRQSSYDGTEDNSTLSRSQLCLTCKDSMEGASAKSSPSISKSMPLIAASVSAHLWEPVLFSSMRNLPEHLAGEEDTGVYQSLPAASSQMAEKQSMSQNVSANFLPQADVTTTGQEKRWRKDISENSLLKVTRAIPKPAVSGKGGGNKPKKESHLVATQLGVLLGVSAILGMILAIGLRCIHSQYCHKRTEVSFSEPDNNVIVLQESGEMMHFRKIRENSFVLVQAEYNWINPSGNGIKAVG